MPEAGYLTKKRDQVNSQLWSLKVQNWAAPSFQPLVRGPLWLHHNMPEEYETAKMPSASCSLTLEFLIS